MTEDQSISIAYFTIHQHHHHNDDEQKHQEYYHVDDTITIITKEVAVFNHRMTQNCVTNEEELRHAVNDANDISSSTPTNIDICKKYIIMTSQIDINDKSIQFNCIILSNQSELCTFDVQIISRHFWIQNSIVLFKQLVFMNGKVSGNGYNNSSGGSLYINNASTVDIIINCSFFTNEASRDGGAIYINNSASNLTISNSILTYNTAITVSFMI